MGTYHDELVECFEESGEEADGRLVDIRVYDADDLECGSHQVDCGQVIRLLSQVMLKT